MFLKSACECILKHSAECIKYVQLSGFKKTSWVYFKKVLRSVFFEKVQLSMYLKKSLGECTFFFLKKEVSILNTQSL